MRLNISMPRPLQELARASFRCSGCASICAAPPSDWRCPRCGELLELTRPANWLPGSPSDWKEKWWNRRLSHLLQDQSGVWRFREAIWGGEACGAPVTLCEGNAPLYNAPRCAAWAGLENLQAKHLGMNPTGSFKDGGMTVAVSHAHALGAKIVACASTGNTSASMAGYCARAGLKCLVLVPAGKTSSSKLAQALDFGAVVCEVRTDFDGCVRLLAEVANQAGVYVVNSVNPFRLEGQKTAALEILETFGWDAPDHVLVPGGNLANASALGKGFLEMHERSLVASVPKISIVQAAGANPLVRSLRESGGRELQPLQAETLATAIRIGNPASWKRAVRVLERTGGACLDVEDWEIAEAKAQIGREGIGCEPASAAVLAGARKLASQGFIKAGERVVMILTGHALKDPDFVLRYHSGELRNLAGAPPRGSDPIEAVASQILRKLEQHA